MKVMKKGLPPAGDATRGSRDRDTGQGLGRPRCPLPPVMVDLEREGTRWDWIMPSLLEAVTGKPGRKDKGMGTNWQRYVETLIAEQEPLSSFNLTCRSEYMRYHTHDEVGLGIVEIVVR